MNFASSQPPHNATINDTATTKIRIRTPTPDPDTLKGHLTTARPLSHYLTSALSKAIKLKLRAQYSSSAITHLELHHLASVPWPGTRLPWRVRHLPSPASKTAPSLASRQPASGRTKPNKKRRIALRTHTRRGLIERAKTEVTVKADEEKRKSRNRVKKLKRRAKKKDKAKNKQVLMEKDEEGLVEVKGQGKLEEAPK